MTAIECLDQPPTGWFALDVMREHARKWDWVACEFPALFYVHPKEYRPGERKAQQRWMRIPGKHRNKDAAWVRLRA